MARQERMVRERVRRDMGMGDSDEEDEGDADADVPAGWGRKKSAYYKEGDSEVMSWHSRLCNSMKNAQHCMLLLMTTSCDTRLNASVQPSVPAVEVDPQLLPNFKNQLNQLLPASSSEAKCQSHAQLFKVA